MVRNKVIFSSAYNCICMYSEDHVCYVVVFSSSVLDGTVEVYKNVLLAPKLLAG